MKRIEPLQILLDKKTLQKKLKVSDITRLWTTNIQIFHTKCKKAEKVTNFKYNPPKRIYMSKIQTVKFCDIFYIGR